MFTLRDYQKPIAGKVFSYMRANKTKHPLVALPTGAGKTVVLSDVILNAVTNWPETNILVLSHVKEILRQDYNSIKFHTGMDIGLYSSGLDSRQKKQITVAGIQSVYRRPELFEKTQLVIIDECHLIPPSDNSMYRKFFAGLERPRYFGLTATPFRLGGGLIYGHEDAIFDDLIVDYTTMERFNMLIENGYLCRLKTHATDNEFDTSGIKTVQGDFDLKGMSLAFDRDYITNKCVEEIVKYGSDYNKWLIFAIDIAHAEHIAECLLQKHKIYTAVVHSKMEMDRDAVIQNFKDGLYKAIVNVDVLTTGFDDPAIDLIALLRPTKSPVIHVQTIGRGLRPFPGKDHCLILDFAGNTERLGPINDVYVKTKGKGTGGDPVVKKCPVCETLHHPTVKICPFCNHEFQFKVGLDPRFSQAEIIREKSDCWHNVTSVKYAKYEKAHRPPMVKVTYECGLRFFNEYVCIEHPGYAGYKAKHWAKYRGVEAETADDILNAQEVLKKPTKIKVNTSRKYPEITEFLF